MMFSNLTNFNFCMKWEEKNVGRILYATPANPSSCNVHQTFYLDINYDPHQHYDQCHILI